MNNSVELRVRVLLTMQSALLGSVKAAMRAVVVSWTETDVAVRILFDEDPSAADIELVSEIESEVISHLPDHSVKCCAEPLKGRANIQLRPGEVFVYRRADCP